MSAQGYSNFKNRNHVRKLHELYRLKLRILTPYLMHINLFKKSLNCSIFATDRISCNNGKS